VIGTMNHDEAEAALSAMSRLMSLLSKCPCMLVRYANISSYRISNASLCSFLAHVELRHPLDTRGNTWSRICPFASDRCLSPVVMQFERNPFGDTAC